MASFPALTLLLLNLSLLLLLCSVQASYEAVEIVGGAHSPHSLPTLTPAPAPKPHKGHHHYHHPSHAPVHSPAHTPVHPPTHAPVHPPTHVPVHPPTRAPVHPPTHVPVHPPTHAPVHPPAMPPIHPHPHPVPERKLLAVQGVVYCKPCAFVGVGTVWKAKPLEGAVVRITCNNTKYKPVVKEATTDKNGYFLILPEKVTNAAYHKCRVALVKSPSKQCDIPTNFRDGWTGAMLTPSTQPPPKEWPKILQLFTVGPFAFEPSKKIPCPR